jgi:hypothetical protein
VTRQLEKFRPYLGNKDTRPTRSGLAILSCMDDRPLQDKTITPAIQLGASVLGLATDTLLASSIEQGTPLHLHPDILAKILGDLLSDSIRGDLHQSCLAEAALLTTAQSIASCDPNKLLTTVNQLATGVDSDKVEQVIDMYGRIVDSGNVIRSTEVAAQSMATSEPRGPIALQRNQLIDSGHVARDVIANHTTGWFDTRGAYQADTPAYNISFGHLPELAGQMADFLAVNEDMLTISSLVRHAATIPALPHPDGADGQLTIHRYETPLPLVS